MKNMGVPTIGDSFYNLYYHVQLVSGQMSICLVYIVPLVQELLLYRSVAMDGPKANHILIAAEFKNQLEYISICFLLKLE